MAALIIFQKNAILGKVKTRLASTTGDEQALEIYNWMTTYTHQIANQIRVDKFLFYSDFIPQHSDEILHGYQFEVQSGANLGERMSNAFAYLFAKGYSSVVIIGTDCPELKVSDLNKAFLALSQNDLVIGPAKDGGYYLLGKSCFCPELFRDIPWSTSKVLELTLDRADEANLHYEFLNIKSDIDTIEDWEKFTAQNKIIHE
ncbi:MAG TPA: TIGR04282 family arsenosugar biosynthesis glycosyltransferase [Algoriphagus sp.]|nr:TIGR04282 family arsenosugar biosynthesis glycosyltransferase [Algoriphagus sp.]